jgi:hypothetical protein
MELRVFAVKSEEENKNDYDNCNNPLLHIYYNKKEGKTRIVNTKPQNGMGRRYLAFDSPG